jgi:hypothetical protein
MTISDENFRETLSKIAELASGAVKQGGYSADGSDRAHEDNGHRRGRHKDGAQFGCFIKTLPTRVLVDAAETATRINPINAPVFGRTAELAAGLPTRMMASIVVSKYWGAQPRQLTVSFVEGTPSDLRARIVSNMNAWTNTACISFAETQGTGDVRISRGSGGYWSYLGTDILHIPKSLPTMNLEGFTMNTPDSEYKRVVRHETGHTLGMPHEHMRRDLVALLDPEKTYAYFLRNQGWNRQTVDEQVLTPLEERTLFSTPADQTSIMCYQLPGAITRNGRPIPGGIDINETDFAFAGERYPKFASGDAIASIGRAAAIASIGRADEWEASEDVEVRV